ncbi:periplasmic heavy metal sensor [Sphingomonas sp. Mn802worker]|uniref:periplasmic heavy metal sensor n=1 Tax=Sphingomonas sp. Mn802worker TaxID=629773 RepID=UPI00037435E7|nr:periplasmic heavy metal sensor [Sphingomonas sp. Mn802worker]
MTRIRIALIVSVMLNLFLAGALVAGYASLRTGKRMVGAGSLRIAGAELPLDERRQFRQALRQTRRSLRPTIEASRAAKTAGADLLRQTPVDQAAVAAALARARAADSAVRAAMEQRAIVFAAGLPAADRAKLADAMARRSAKGNARNE